MFIKCCPVKGRNYYSLAESIRDVPGEAPRHKILDNLGDYESAVSAIKRKKLPDATKTRLLKSLERMEMQNSEAQIAKYDVIVCALADVFKVLEFANENSALCLWFTSHEVGEACKVFTEAGYETRLMLTMTIVGQQEHHKLLDYKAYHCIIGTKGKMAIKRIDGHNLLTTTKSQLEVPASFYKMIEMMFPETKKIQLMSSTKRQGWEVSIPNLGN